MIGLYVVLVIVIGIVSSIGLACYFNYKPKQLEFTKANVEQTTEISVKALMLEIEKEKTKQMEIDADAFKEKEKTIQYEIKSKYKDKHDSTLY